MSGRSFSGLLHSPALARLRQAVEAQQRLDAVWQAVLPASLRGQCQAVRLDGGCLKVAARSAAVLVMLRQMEPRLLAALAGRDVHVSAIRSQVQVANLPHREQKTKRNLALSEQAVTALEAAASQMQPSPLRDALARMAARHRAAKPPQS